MKKFLKMCFVLMLGTTSLTCCTPEEIYVDYSEYELPNFFHFYDRLGEAELSIGEYDVKDIIKLTKEEFVNKYLDGHLEDRYPDYRYINMTYSTGTQFVFHFATTNEYLNRTPRDYEFGPLWQCSGWNVYINYQEILN